jgi:integrase
MTTAAGKGRRTVARVRSYLGLALVVAQRRNKISRNVGRIAEMPATPPPAQRRSLTTEQATALLRAAEANRLKALFVTGLMLGLRPGELTGLRWQDVDLKAGRVVVDVSLKRERGKLRLGETKTAKSRRVLKIPSPVIDALQAHRVRQKEEQLRAGPSWMNSGLVFTTEVGTPIDPTNLRRAFHKLTDQAGLGPWAPNELRHSAASLLSAAGVPLEEIADVLGHVGTRMLEQHYRHQTRPAVEAHVATMEGLFGR